MWTATASVYCSLNTRSAMAVENLRPPRPETYHDGRGREPVMVVARGLCFVALIKETSCAYHCSAPRMLTQETGRRAKGGRRHSLKLADERPCLRRRS